MSDFQIHILLKHKEKYFKTLCNLNHINFKIICHYNNNKLLFAKVYLASHHNYSKHNCSFQLIHHRFLYCKVCLYFQVCFEFNSILILKYKQKFLLTLWMIVVYLKELLAKPYHLEHIYQIILWLSVCQCWLLKYKQLLFLLLFILNSTVQLLRPFITWKDFILNLWLQYLLRCLLNLLWYVKISHCQLTMLVCSIYTLQASFRLDQCNMLSLWSSTSK